MFQRSQRLRTTKDIITVLRQGVKRSTGLVTCFFLAKPGSLSRVTVIVDSKFSKNATDRNLGKRRVRAILKEQKLPAGDLIIRLYKGAGELSFDQLKTALLQCLTNIR